MTVNSLNTGEILRRRAEGQVWIKVCGLTSAEEARAVAALGVDAVGFVLDAGVRRTTADLVLSTAEGWPPGVARVGVFAVTPAEQVVEAARWARLDLIQLHGDYPPEESARVAEVLGRKRVIRAFRFREGDQPDPSLFRAYLPWAGAFLVEPRVEGTLGGTGVRLPVEMVRAIQRVLHPEIPLILAGGLKPENVAGAVRLPVDGIDASSGLERSAGCKDMAKVRLFVETARRGRRIQYAEQSGEGGAGGRG